ncbi:unnamed protein product [Ambrosiozyma monospora]|uniref:Unnamed protein product n=1 Tax=Ambrosiozyma monospora TaxID=43982 RepID=A0ACB5SUR8_AMBMO|nr:unnamed protein product [Ambrosiozyma monospora]
MSSSSSFLFLCPISFIALFYLATVASIVPESRTALDRLLDFISYAALDSIIGFLILDSVDQLIDLVPKKVVKGKKRNMKVSIDSLRRNFVPLFKIGSLGLFLLIEVLVIAAIEL